MSQYYYYKDVVNLLWEENQRIYKMPKLYK